MRGTICPVTYKRVINYLKEGKTCIGIGIIIVVTNRELKMQHTCLHVYIYNIIAKQSHEGCKKCHPMGDDRGLA